MNFEQAHELIGEVSKVGVELERIRRLNAIKLLHQKILPNNATDYDFLVRMTYGNYDKEMNKNSQEQSSTSKKQV